MGGGDYLKKYIMPPDLPLPASTINQRVPYALVASHIPFEPQLWLQVDAVSFCR